MAQRFFRSTIAATFLLVAASTYSENTIEIAVTGLYEWESQITPGVDWWGIFPDGKDGYTLRPTRVSAVPDPSMVHEGEKAPRKICVPDKSGNVIVIRGLTSVTPGPLKSVKLAEYPAPLTPGEHYDLHWELETPETRMRLRTAGRPVLQQVGKHTLRRVDDYELWLQRGSGEGAVMQLLVKEPESFGDESPRLRWAGDLDQDGELDLIYNLGGHYTQTRLALYLSSAAKPGELVGLVAQWNGTCGC